jgi:hypothetical protein
MTAFKHDIPCLVRAMTEQSMLLDKRHTKEEQVPTTEGPQPHCRNGLQQVLPCTMTLITEVFVTNHLGSHHLIFRTANVAESLFGCLHWLPK